jgi:hypothetical protein
LIVIANNTYIGNYRCINLKGILASDELSDNLGINKDYAIQTPEVDTSYTMLIKSSINQGTLINAHN